ncbi:hypothetical protein DPMN_125032 [Dreissena polymorpha]|uniref:Uncharacterized protein n=1 Tax=Dreissena polymorpha TaxID=45954 RepID=A0A9D4JWS1_DREPO|nr:hypothetical protein DPMN_125032 [Dreissena polymorpha]
MELMICETLPIGNIMRNVIEMSGDIKFQISIIIKISAILSAISIISVPSEDKYGQIIIFFVSIINIYVILVIIITIGTDSIISISKHVIVHPPAISSSYRARAYQGRVPPSHSWLSS